MIIETKSLNVLEVLSILMEK